MSALTEARNPILLRPVSNLEAEDVETSRLNRNGWIVVLIVAILFAILLGFSSRADPEILSRIDQTALID